MTTADTRDAEIEQLRANVEKLIIRNNELSRERDAAIRAARRPVDAIDLDAVRGRLAEAARRLEHVAAYGDARIRDAIDTMTDTVRVLYHAGGHR